jgi:hypothetical protein
MILALDVSAASEMILQKEKKTEFNALYESANPCAAASLKKHQL